MVVATQRKENEDIDVINIRLASICREESPPQPYRAQPIHPWAPASVAMMTLSDAIKVFTLAVESSAKPGVRIMNAVAAKSHVADPIPKILRTWYPDLTIDLSHYERPGHELDPIFDITRVREELGFIPKVVPVVGP